MRVRGKMLPLTAVVGGIWHVRGVVRRRARLTPTGASSASPGWALGILMYVVYRKRKGYSLTKTVKAVPLPESVQADIDYDQLLVPIVGSRITDEMMVLACQLATEKQSAVDALYVIEVPLQPAARRAPAAGARQRQGGARAGGRGRRPVRRAR